MLTILKASAVALALGGVFVTGTVTETATWQTVSDIRTERTNENVPAILQVAPESDLICTIEAERVFKPARRAFVTERVQVCR